MVNHGHIDVDLTAVCCARLGVVYANAPIFENFCAGKFQKYTDSAMRKGLQRQSRISSTGIGRDFFKNSP